MTMPVGKYPEDSNIIDFIEVKLLSMADDYASGGRLDLAEAIWTALDRYMTGEIEIIFKHGEPYVTAANDVDFVLDEKDE
jgi:hypothetical protein